MIAVPISISFVQYITHQVLSTIKSAMKNKTTINSTLSDKLSAIVHSAESADIRCRIVLLSMALGALPRTTIKQNFLLDTK